MAYSIERLTVVANNAKSGAQPKLMFYYNSASDDVTAAGYFVDNRLSVGDQIIVVAANYTSQTTYRVSAVSAGAATVVALTTSILLTAGEQTLSGAGAVDVTNGVTLLVTTGANALTLADGVSGQRKIIIMKTDGGDGTLTPTHFKNGSTITFGDVGDSVELIFADSAWCLLSNNGATIA